MGRMCEFLWPPVLVSNILQCSTPPHPSPVRHRLFFGCGSIRRNISGIHFSLLKCGGPMVAFSLWDIDSDGIVIFLKKSYTPRCTDFERVLYLYFLGSAVSVTLQLHAGNAWYHPHEHRVLDKQSYQNLFSHKDLQQHWNAYCQCLSRWPLLCINWTDWLLPSCLLLFVLVCAQIV